MSDQVLISIVTGGFTVVVAAIGYLAHTNRQDHNSNASKLDRVLEATETLKDGHGRIENKIDNHIGDHARGEV